MARIQHKHDIEANWLKAASFIPMAGELVVYDPDENHSQPRFKYGDGVTKVNNLPFVSDAAKADKYFLEIPLEVGTDLSGKTLKFDTTVDYYASYSYSYDCLKSSGGYTIATNFPSLVLAKGERGEGGTYTNIIATFATYSNGAATWQMDEYTLPDDFGTITQVYPGNQGPEDLPSLFISVENTEVDCEYLYKNKADNYYCDTFQAVSSLKVGDTIKAIQMQDTIAQMPEGEDEELVAFSNDGKLLLRHIGSGEYSLVYNYNGSDTTLGQYTQSTEPDTSGEYPYLWITDYSKEGFKLPGDIATVISISDYYNKLSQIVQSYTVLANTKVDPEYNYKNKANKYITRQTKTISLSELQVGDDLRGVTLRIPQLPTTSDTDISADFTPISNNFAASKARLVNFANGNILGAAYANGYSYGMTTIEQADLVGDITYGGTAFLRVNQTNASEWTVTQTLTSYTFPDTDGWIVTNVPDSYPQVVIDTTLTLDRLVTADPEYNYNEIQKKADKYVAQKQKTIALSDIKVGDNLSGATIIAKADTYSTGPYFKIVFGNYPSSGAQNDIGAILGSFTSNSSSTLGGADCFGLWSYNVARDCYDAFDSNSILGYHYSDGTYWKNTSYTFPVVDTNEFVVTEIPTGVNAYAPGHWDNLAEVHWELIVADCEYNYNAIKKKSNAYSTCRLTLADKLNNFSQDNGPAYGPTICGTIENSTSGFMLYCSHDDYVAGGVVSLYYLPDISNHQVSKRIFDVSGNKASGWDYLNGMAVPGKITWNLGAFEGEYLTGITLDDLNAAFKVTESAIVDCEYNHNAIQELKEQINDGHNVNVGDVANNNYTSYENGAINFYTGTGVGISYYLPMDSSGTLATKSYVDNAIANAGGSSGSGSSSGGNIYYGTCSTASGTSQKDVTCSNFTSLTTGATIIVKFTNTNTVTNPKLKVGSTTATYIKEYGTSNGTLNGRWSAGGTATFVYDGTYWLLVSTHKDNNTSTNASLGQVYGTCSTAAATTEKTVSLSSYTLTTGGIVSILFEKAVPASATLNISSRGAKPIYYRNAAITAGVIGAGDTATFIYDGSKSYYRLISIDYAQAESQTV